MTDQGLWRIALKITGIVFLVLGVSDLIGHLVGSIWFVQRPDLSGNAQYVFLSLLSPLLAAAIFIAAGAVLFFCPDLKWLGLHYVYGPSRPNDADVLPEVMSVEAYAQQQGLEAEQVIARIKAGDERGFVHGDKWFIEPKDRRS